MENKEFFRICGSILSIMICLGLIGNVISFVTWRVGKRCRNLPGATYLSALSLSDILVLGTAGIKYAIQLLFGLNLWDLNSVSCTLFHTTWHLFFLVSSWTVVFLTLERTIAVSQPLKSTWRTSQKTELVVVCSLFAVSLLINLPFTFGAKMIPANRNALQDANVTNANVINNSNNSEHVEISHGFINDSGMIANGSTSTKADDMVCGADPDSFYSKYNNEFHNWFMDFGLLFAAPVSILTICNFIILIVLCRRKWDPALKDARTNQGLSRALTARVMILSLVQCVSVGPFSIAALVPGVIPDVKAVDTVFVDRLLTILVLIWYLNNCVNFILYSLFGNAFRRDCVDLFRKICPSRQSRGSSVRFSNMDQDNMSGSSASKFALVESSSTPNRSHLDV